MRDIIIQLQEEAEDLGFSTIQEAKDAGYEEDINYENGIARLVIDREQEAAHEAWLKEKSMVLTNLAQLKIYLSNKVEHFEFCGKDDWEILEDAIEFIEKGEC